ncbi:hypothetical protein FB45DRAFT_940784 [Roridomyces roridus]|uniref:Uncharacterized protein n=1 Tax=Roridomyces roridus TaxID=1738132 RepID=A0AAD7B6Y5_9AGAR|nr:hypothetical protein FB45DRAFT_940784 [Roridomyces roridus]
MDSFVRSTPHDDTDPPASHHLIAGFMFLQIFGGHFGIPLLLLTALISRNVQRHPVLLSFCATWFIYATSFTLLLYAGKQTGPQPSMQLCIVQAAFMYGSPVMTSAAGLAFVLHLWFSLSTDDTNAWRWRKILLLTGPYILFTGFAITMAVVGSLNQEKVSRAVFYCSIDLPIVNIVPATSAVIVLLVLIFEVLIGVKLFCLNRAYKRMSAGMSRGYGRSRNQPDASPASADQINGGRPPTHLFVRIALFSVYSLLALVGCVVFWSSRGNDFAYLIQASLPTAAFLIFGTQDDLWRAWGSGIMVLSCRRDRSRGTHVVIPDSPTAAERWPKD